MVPEPDQFEVVDGFTRPDWEAIFADSDALDDEALTAKATMAARWWSQKVRTELDGSYDVLTSTDFLVVSPLDSRRNAALLKFLARTRRSIMKKLDGIASTQMFGPHVLFLFSDRDDYYRYINYFYPPDSVNALSAGVFLRVGYRHLALPFDDVTSAESTIAHELTHLLLSDLALPLWLDEGLAVQLEDEITGSWPLQMTPDRFAEHAEFWTPETIQEFWSGASFNRPDAGGMLSYELARYSVRALAHDYDCFVRFANRADYRDAGEAAALEFYGGSLAGLIDQFLGEGDWAPAPRTWEWYEGQAEE